jgi:hypothetical protein
MVVHIYSYAIQYIQLQCYKDTVIVLESDGKWWYTDTVMVVKIDSYSVTQIQL